MGVRRYFRSISSYCCCCCVHIASIRRLRLYLSRHASFAYAYASSDFHLLKLYAFARICKILAQLLSISYIGKHLYCICLVFSSYAVACVSNWITNRCSIAWFYIASVFENRFEKLLKARRGMSRKIIEDTRYPGVEYSRSGQSWEYIVKPTSGAELWRIVRSRLQRIGHLEYIHFVAI